MLFKTVIDAIYDRLPEFRTEEPDRPRPDHPVGEGLELTDNGTAREFQEAISEEVQVSLVPGEDPRLGEISMTFVDENGVAREWTATHNDYDPRRYDEPN